MRLSTCSNASGMFDYSFLQHFFFNFLAHFYIHCALFFLLICRTLERIKRPLHVVFYAKLFSYLVSLVFIISVVSFEKEKVLILIYSIVSIFFIVSACMYFLRNLIYFKDMKAFFHLYLLHASLFCLLFRKM